MKKHSRLSLEGASALSRDEMKKVVGGNGYMPNPYSCSSFLDQDGNVYECPEGMHYASHLGVCTWPIDSGCEDAGSTQCHSGNVGSTCYIQGHPGECVYVKNKGTYACAAAWVEV